MVSLAKEFIEKDDFEVNDFIDFIFQIQSLKPACSNIQNSYLIALISYILYSEISTAKALSFEYIPNSKRILLGIASHHLTGKGLSDNSLLLCIGKLMFKEIDILLKEYVTQSIFDRKILLYPNILTLTRMVSFELILFSLKNIKNYSNPTSIYQLFINQTVPYLPNSSSFQYTLVLDLDETLGHFQDNCFLPRPGAQHLLESLSRKYELVLFTSADENYATNALKVVDPYCFIKFRLFRQHLSKINNAPVKDLSVLGRELNRVLIVDDRSSNFRMQPENGIKIKPWLGDPDDREFVKLQHLLLRIYSTRTTNLVETLKECISFN